MSKHLLRILPAFVSTAILTFALLSASTTSAATLLLHYDFNNPLSWNGTTLVDLQGFGSALTPDDGAPRTQSSPNTVPADFGNPVFTASGAISPVTPPVGYTTRNRAFLDFTLFGTLVGSNKDQNIFDTPGAGDNGTNANIAGYSLEGFFLIRTGYAAAENGGIGFVQSTNGENQLIRVPRGTNTSLGSNSSVDNAAGAPNSVEQIDTNINSIIPRDQWFHIVKVHDPLLDQTRFYINGVLQAGATTPLDADNTGLEYHPFGLSYGNVSVAGREIKNIGYSMTRFYRGALTDTEILANFRQVAFVPEPSGFMLLALAMGSFWIARRRRA